MFKVLEDEAESADFDDQSIEEETQFQKTNPMYIDYGTLRDYYGEKIALYFNFVQFLGNR